MAGRRRRAAFGLRSRIVGLVLIAAAATLAVAAVALLGPLENELRNASQQTFQKDLRGGPEQPFARLPLADLSVVSRHRQAVQALTAQQRALASRIGAGTIVYVLGYPGVGADSARGRPIARAYPSDLNVFSDGYQDAAQAFHTQRRVFSFGLIGGTDFTRAAIPFTNGGQPFVLAVRRPVGEVSQATHVVRTAFITAALAALALTLLLGIPVSARLVRRLRRLRLAATELASGGPGVELPVDRARDEVGDLARAFAGMQQQLRHQEEARRQFVATASHELRTPLTSLDGILELLDEDLRDENPDLHDARSLLQRARVQSRRLARLAADLLDLSRIDAEVPLRSEPVELTELSRAVLAEFELGTVERGIRTVLDDTGPAWVWADPGSVARILRILLDNAVRVSPRGSTITVQVGGPDGSLLRVCDEGPGVAPEERDAIFDRFQRGRATGGQAGFGLGLAIGRELAVRMQGTLELEDRGGSGAMFVLRLPRALAPEESPAAV